MTKQSCKTCKHLDVPLTATGRRVVGKYNTYPCKAPAPELPAMPECVSTHYTWQKVPQRRRMSGGEGAYCPSWEQRA